LMLDEFEKIADDGITDDELERSLGMLGGAAALALEDSDTRMNRLGRSEITTGEFVDLDESLARLGRVTPDEVRLLASDLRRGALSTVVVGDVEASAFETIDFAHPASSPASTA